MKLTFDANNTKVYDNILDQTQFKKLFNFMNFVPMVHKRSHGEWNRVWGFGDGSTLETAKTRLGVLGSVICWENYMPMMRMSMYDQGIELYCAPTADDLLQLVPSHVHVIPFAV